MPDSESDPLTVQPHKTSLLLLSLFKNISIALSDIRDSHKKTTDLDSVVSSPKDEHYNDGANAWLYILFVLMFYAFSIVVLMVKYIR